ncbi:MAG: DUF520 family protein, partial [Actinomycetota bacterium]
EKMVRRDVPLKGLQEGKLEPAARGQFRQTITVVEGISEEKGRTLNKAIKGLGLRVQSQMQGDQLRVTAKSKDDLQQVIKALKEDDFEIPLQFTNYR